MAERVFDDTQTSPHGVIRYLYNDLDFNGLAAFESPKIEFEKPSLVKVGFIANPVIAGGATHRFRHFLWSSDDVLASVNIRWAGQEGWVSGTSLDPSALAYEDGYAEKIATNHAYGMERIQAFLPGEKYQFKYINGGAATSGLLINLWIVVLPIAGY